MKIVTTGSLGNVANLVVKKLITAGHNVTVITSKSERTAPIEALGATAAVGSISDADFLTKTFEGSDAVFTMVPPTMGTTNMIENIANAGKAYVKAIQTANVKRVVMLSSVGADAAEGTGPIRGVHHIEESFKTLTQVNLTVLRSGFFYSNFFRDIPLIKARNTFGNNYKGDDRLLLTHPDDLSRAIAQELQIKGNGHEVKYVISDISTGNKIASILGQAIGKPELGWSQVPDDILQQGLTSAGLPAELIGLVVEMGQGVRTGIITRHFFESGQKVSGRIKTEQFANEFKEKYEQA
ncbi:NAD(P)H-binding protein [Mucilaginibacter sp. OK098]|uniref:NAD(P)H-binding protein n=1 Tax=Mucilaginibacter sp. OK098 TaxID=1855297 RepID=UPI0009100CFF|nr:NAD(P)H-binding protein [Mucilaginibacter sp. OK098]SHM71851.1 Uncharacterized conserved protein YbjT, contains NAD(P)-binding and DUF2867 domains [Mucilaginibacter sp. OK098]